LWNVRFSPELWKAERGWENNVGDEILRTCPLLFNVQGLWMAGSHAAAWCRRFERVGFQGRYIPRYVDRPRVFRPIGDFPPVGRHHTPRTSHRHSMLARTCTPRSL